MEAKPWVKHLMSPAEKKRNKMAQRKTYRFLLFQDIRTFFYVRTIFWQTISSFFDPARDQRKPLLVGVVPEHRRRCCCCCCCNKLRRKVADICGTGGSWKQRTVSWQERRSGEEPATPRAEAVNNGRKGEGARGA